MINRPKWEKGGALPTEREHGMQAPFWDASQVNQFSPLDALVVINELNTFLEGRLKLKVSFGMDWLMIEWKVMKIGFGRLIKMKKGWQLRKWNDTPGEIQRTIDSFVTELEQSIAKQLKTDLVSKIADELELNLPS